METISALLALCVEFDVIFDVRVNKRLSKQS